MKKHSEFILRAICQEKDENICDKGSRHFGDGLVSKTKGFDTNQRLRYQSWPHQNISELFSIPEENLVLVIFIGIWASKSSKIENFT